VHTDEYAISLSRELDVCKYNIKRVRYVLTRMEKKYNLESDVFLRKISNGELDKTNSDFINWKNKCASLGRWQLLLKEYENLLKRMKT